MIQTIISKRLSDGFQPVIVCSAFSGVSDALERLVIEAVEGREANVLGEIEKQHRDMVNELGVRASVIERDLEELVRLAKGIALTHEVSSRLKAQVMSFGEILSTRLGAAFLNAAGLACEWSDARKHLCCRENAGDTPHRRYLHATCGYERDEHLIETFSANRRVTLTQGFIAGTPKGDTVLLGRGGSDVSAAYFAARLGAVRCEIWTDVPGMYTANPRRVPQARLLKSLAYDEAQELASAGAKVLHPRTMRPVSAHGIPLHIKCLAHPDLEGTVISAQSGESGAQVKAISAKGGIMLVSMETVDMWHQVGFLAKIFDCFKQHNLSIDIVSTSETNVSVTLDRMTNALEPDIVSALKADLGAFCQVRIVDSCAHVNLVGRNIRAILHKIGPALEVFEEQKIHLVSQAANDLNLTFVVDEDQADRLVQELHGVLFDGRKHDDLFGQSWQELTQVPKAKGAEQAAPWWNKKRGQLLDLAHEKSPLFVYDEETIRARARELMALKNLDAVLYSLKANSNPDVLRIIAGEGLGFECVSPGEIAHIMKLFPNMEMQRVLFTPNFAAREEYAFAFEVGTRVTLDNIYPLEAWPEIFKDREIFVRIDPGIGAGHHKFVKTAGAKSKFGVSTAQLPELKKLLASCGARVAGLHAHVGSNIFTPEKWSDTALFLANVAEAFPDVTILDLGGGLGVVERPGQEPLDLHEVDAHLARIREAYPRYRLWIEPGRYLVAEAGVLIAKMTQTKQKGDYRYVGIDVGMNSFIRPVLYGSYHDIVNLSGERPGPKQTVNIVGPICESGDVLGHERSMAWPRDGDVLLLATAGAYGRAMSSAYNMREPAEERVLAL
jgi:diaminopimelate decarboxylase/aspartate kinase